MSEPHPVRFEPDEAEAERLAPEEIRALSVLAFMYFRMGLAEKAARIYRVLAEEGSAADQRRAQAGLAAASFESGNLAGALTALNEALRSGALASGDAPLYLLKAQILWAQGRTEEAQAARDEYLSLSGEARRARESAGTEGEI